MKIAWLTPFCSNSAIGDFSRIVTNSLSKHIEIDLWAPKTKVYHSSNLSRYDLCDDDAPWSKLKDYDFIVANFGDNYSYHKEIYNVSLYHPTVAILHDIVGHHFFTGMHFYESNQAEKHVAMMERYYGFKGRKVVEQSLAGHQPHVWDTDEVIRYPLFEPFVENAIAVVVHSHYYKSLLSENYHGPILTNLLPYFYDEDRLLLQTTRQQLGIKENEKLIVTIGNINENKQIDATLKAIASSQRLRNSIQMIVIGACGHYYYNKLMPLMKGLQLTSNIKFLDRVSDHLLDSYLSNADMAINLRRPVMEGGSASLTRLMYHNLPIVVSDQGVYSELPDDVLIKVSNYNEIEGVKQALNLLLDYPNAIKAMGQRAGQYVRKYLTPEVYANSLLKFLKKLYPSKNLALNHLRELLHDQMSQIKANNIQDFTNQIDSELTELFNVKHGNADW